MMAWVLAIISSSSALSSPSVNPAKTWVAKKVAQGMVHLAEQIVVRHQGFVWSRRAWEKVRLYARNGDVAFDLHPSHQGLGEVVLPHRVVGVKDCKGMGVVLKGVINGRIDLGLMRR